MGLPTYIPRVLLVTDGLLQQTTTPGSILSAKNNKRLRWARHHQHWTNEEWKNIAWSDASRFLLRHADGRVRISHRKLEPMAPSCMVSTVQTAGGGVQLRDATELWCVSMVLQADEKKVCTRDCVVTGIKEKSSLDTIQLNQ